MNHRDPETQSFFRRIEPVATHREKLHLRLVNLCVSVSLWLIAISFTACSIPNLETADCTAARTAVREFYSFHFGNDMKFSQDNLALREKFLTPGFAGRLRGQDVNIDPFTLTSDPPKAFRVGACTVVEPEKHTRFEVLLFWKTDTQSKQVSINADVVNSDGRWMIDGVSVDKRQ
jgi:hypothetical protein